MSIKDRRAEIDRIDGELLRLLNMRAVLAVKVGENKKAAGLSLCDREREREVIARACRANKGPLDESAVVSLFRCIIRASRLAEARVMEEPDARKKGERNDEQANGRGARGVSGRARGLQRGRGASSTRH